jgi:TatA/E family protein of Tat protein translocase
MGSLGWPEILVILVVALIIFGPRKLPELGKTLGQSLAQFRKASEDFKRTWEDEVEMEKRRLDTRQTPEPRHDFQTSPVTEPAGSGTHWSPGSPGDSPSSEIPGTVPAFDPSPAPAATEPAATETKRDWR